MNDLILFGIWLFGGFCAVTGVSAVKAAFESVEIMPRVFNGIYALTCLILAWASAWVAMN